MPGEPAYQDELMLREGVSAMLQAKDNQFSVTGRIPMDSAQLVLFFRSKVRIFLVDYMIIEYYSEWHYPFP